VAAAAGGVALPSLAEAQILGGAHSEFNHSPFGDNQTAVDHQVYRSGLFNTATRITSVGFAPGANGVYAADVEIRLGYTDRLAGFGPVSGGLHTPLAGGGAPNAAIAPMRLFRSGGYANTFVNPSDDNFQMVFMDVDTFRYNPALGNLLVEIVAQTGNTDTDLTVSRSGGGPLASRSDRSDRSGDAASPGQALRTLFTYFVDQLPATPTSTPTAPSTSTTCSNSSTGSTSPAEPSPQLTQPPGRGRDRFPDSGCGPGPGLSWHSRPAAVRRGPATFAPAG
jgi:hypothetical protein